MANTYTIIDVSEPKCPKCGSDRRQKYHTVRTLLNIRIRGVHYGQVKFRRTQCLDCGQCRVERVLYQETTAGREENVALPDGESLDSPECTHAKNSKRRSKRSTTSLPRVSKL